jgi:LPXTG-motif cell wall-anchored protein
MIRKIAVVTAALTLLLSGVAEAGGGDVLYPPEPSEKIVKVVKTVDNKVHTVDNRVHTGTNKVQRGTLPRTGADSLPLTQIGAGLLAVGAVLVLLERNRRAAQASGNRVDIS